MSGQPTVFVLVGLPGAGKTTLAHRLELEHRALRLTPDEWMMPLFGAGESGGKRERLELLLWSVAERVLALGVNVVLDYGLWSRSEREAYLARAEAAGARVELRFLDMPREELWRRLQRRNRELPPDTFAVSEADLELWCRLFEPPGEEELASYPLHS